MSMKTSSKLCAKFHALLYKYLELVPLWEEGHSRRVANPAIFLAEWVFRHESGRLPHVAEGDSNTKSGGAAMWF